MEDKTCIRCSKTLPLTDFVHHIGGKFAITDLCRACHEESREKTDFPTRVSRNIYNENWRAKHFGLVADLTVDQWMELLEVSEGRCYHCRNAVGADKLVIDHIIPVTRGGGTTFSNIVPSCRFCNGSRGSKLLHEWKLEE